MERNEIMTALERIKNGTFVRVKYKSEMPVKAENKKKGISITKYSEATFRTGIKYSNIADVIAEREAKEPTEQKIRKNNDEVLLDNKAVHNTNTNKDYVCFATVKNNANIKSMYLIIIGDKKIIADKLNDEYKAFLIDSALSERKVSYVRKINFENIISIGKMLPLSIEDVMFN